MRVSYRMNRERAARCKQATHLFSQMEEQGRYGRGKPSFCRAAICSARHVRATSHRTAQRTPHPATRGRQKALRGAQPFNGNGENKGRANSRAGRVVCGARVAYGRSARLPRSRWRASLKQNVTVTANANLQVKGTRAEECAVHRYRPGIPRNVNAGGNCTNHPVRGSSEPGWKVSNRPPSPEQQRVITRRSNHRQREHNEMLKSPLSRDAVEMAFQGSRARTSRQRRRLVRECCV